ncbi:MAG TPA: hypothetical protein ENI23_06730 [bacterium]|nr:hypothetical protein [bacterium]
MYAKGKKHGRYHHGMTGTPLYKRWEKMKSRCLNPNTNVWHLYGGRGISVCWRWMNFVEFAEDMGDSFENGMSLERIDNDKGYCKENCKWIPLAEQGKNKRSVKLYEYKGQKKNISEWAEKYGIKRNTLSYRLKVLGWTIEHALETPVHLGNRYRR